MKPYRTFLHSTCALALGALLTVNLSGCTATDLVDEPATAPSELGDVTVIASLGQDTGTRTGHEEIDPDNPDDYSVAIKVSWVPGDAIGIQKSNSADPATTTTFTFVGLDNNGKGIFKGKAKPETADSYCIFYPATAKCSHNTIDLNMTGQTQWGNESMAHLGAYDAMLGGTFTDWYQFGFASAHHLNALMTFDLQGVPADLGRPQSITLGCTGDDPQFYSNTLHKSTYLTSELELRLTGFATPTDNIARDIKAHLMFVPVTIPTGKSLTITVKGDKGSYTFTSDPMVADKEYEVGNRYTATVEAGEWEKVFSGVTYTGTETAERFTGMGTSADPFMIATAGQLRMLRDNVATIRDYSVGKFFRLGSDIRIAMASSVNGGEWQLIGTVSNPFAGTFDGDGHTISGSMTSEFGSLGFFGSINGATIRNLTVDATVYGRSNVGGVAGESTGENSSYIINCINKGTVTAKSGISGGIIGYAKKVYIFGCVNQGEVSAVSTRADYYGGIAGQISGGTIVGCYNTATVIAAEKAGGGIAGGAEEPCSIVACYNTGKVKQMYTAANQLGAIAGRVTDAASSIKYCRYVLDAENAGLPVAPSNSTGSYIGNKLCTDLAALNDAGVGGLNTGITIWNTMNTADKQCLFHFVPGTATTGPTLEAGAPN